MAILQSGNLSFDFRYTGFEHSWLQYQFYFRWENENIVKDSVLKKWSEYWINRPDGAFLANEDQEDGLIPLIKKVLESDQADYWEPIEPDIIVAIYPENFFPFIPSHYKLIRESEKFREKREAREKLKKEKGNLPDDFYTIIIFVDAYNFKNSDAYYGQGLSLQMIVKRYELQDFLMNLESEYKELKQHSKVDE